MRNALYYLLAAILLVCLGMTVGCGAPQITIPSGQASVFYAQARADYATAKLIATRACSGPVIAPQGPAQGPYLDKASCDSLAAIDIQAQTLRKAVEAALMNPSQPIDWAQVMSYAASVSEMLVRLGLLAAK